VLHTLGEFYISKDMPSEALEVYNDIISREPTDMVAQKAAKDASASASMKAQRMEEAEGMKDLVKDADEAKSLESENRAAMTRDQMREKLAELMAKYGENQNDIEVVKKIAWIYEEMGYAPDSYVFYSWAYELSDNDVSLRSKAAEMKKRTADEEVENLQKKLDENPDDEELIKELEEKKAVLQKQAVDDAQARVDENPTDHELRFALGKALYDTEEYSAAIPHLQQATRNPHIKTQALYTLAKTFKEKNMNDLAVKQLGDALEGLHTMDNTKKEILYLMGQIKMSVNKKEEALTFYKQIYEVDYGYLDVAEIVEASYT